MTVTPSEASAATGPDIAVAPDAAGAPAPVPPVHRRVAGFYWALLAIAAVGLVFRMGYVVETRNDASLCGSVLCGDALYYSGQANVIGLGQGFVDPRDGTQPAADHPPLTVLALAPVTAVLGDGPRVTTEQRLLMTIFGALVIIAIGLLGRAAAGSLARTAPKRASTIGLVAAAIAAVNANFWMNDVLVMSETLATLAIALSLLATYRFIARPTWLAAAGVGVLVGIAGLARAELLLLAPITFVPVALWARTLSWPARVGRIGIAAVAVIVVLAPWTLYNRSRFTEPVLMSTNDGLTLVGANCDKVYGIPEHGGIGFWNLSCALDVSDQIPAGADQSVASGVYRRIGVDYIKGHVDRLPEVAVYREARIWGVYGPDQMVWLNAGEGRASWASWVGLVQWWLLLVPAAIGAVLVRRRRDHLWPLASTAVIVMITGLAFYGIVRFRIAADVAVTVLAAVAVEALINRLRTDRAAPTATEPEPTIDLDAVSA